MPKKHLYIIVCCLLIVISAKAQKMSIGGNVQDTVAKAPLLSAVVMAVRIKDSLLLAHTRTDDKGAFALWLPIDTVQVIITHPKFGEQSFYVFGSPANAEFNFGKIILPPKSHELQEIVIYAYKDPVYYKGDTLVYTADSFKVRPNATVEDLLKKLPGIKVDKNGKITSKGKEVQQVLVDGDEFFGSDPTVATKNLNASSIESVQVYEKKNEQASDGDDETIQVMNLQLKDEAKKGYFGKVSGASDFQKFYESNVFLNKFNNKQKISVFGIGSNTPNSSIGWQDASKFGIENEGDGGYWDDEEQMWHEPQANIGIPRTLRGGIYYTEKLSKKTKIVSNYSYSNNYLDAVDSSRSQYFLQDSSYSNENNNRSVQKSEAHTINMRIEYKLDSLTDIKIIPQLKLNSSTMYNNAVTKYFDSNDTLNRTTDIYNSNNTKGYDLNTTATVERRFKKKGRTLYASYYNLLTNNNADALLVSENTFLNLFALLKDSTNQKKNNYVHNTSNTVKINYTEPLTKKIKLSFAYDLYLNHSKKKRETFNYDNGDYLLKDSLYTNNFENQRIANVLGITFRYEVKKYDILFGSKVRQVSIDNSNLVTNQTIHQKVNNILPFARFNYKFADNKRFSINYSTSSEQPTIEQLQPVQDNTNPNQIKKGNPNLLPTFKNSARMFYYSYKGVSGDYWGAQANYTNTMNAISAAIEYDSLGRTITSSVNVDNNYDYRASSYLTKTLFSVLMLSPSVSYNYSRYSNFINNGRNITTTANTSTSMDISLNLDTLELTAGYRYSYTVPNSTINTTNNQPYVTQNIEAGLFLRLPFKMRFNTDFNYTINSKRTQGYNINYFIWNASIEKTFFKLENLIVSINATDLLNQNISAGRTVQDNVITDNKTSVIGRYILLRIVYKFNSAKTKETNEYDY